MSLRNVCRYLLTGLMLFTLVSCTSYTIKTPSSGKTNKFFDLSGENLLADPNYDFSRLDDRFGLVILAYEIEGMSGNNLSGAEIKTKSGLRIWEEKFSNSLQVSVGIKSP